jgi:hypothetical protein
MSNQGASMNSAQVANKGKRHIFRRGPWENVSAAAIGAGIVMLTQPFSIDLYTWSFDVILLGTVAFIITSHFPE